MPCMVHCLQAEPVGWSPTTCHTMQHAACPDCRSTSVLGHTSARQLPSEQRATSGGGPPLWSCMRMGASPLQTAPPLRQWTQSCSAPGIATATPSWLPQIWLTSQKTGAAITGQRLSCPEVLSSCCSSFEHCRPRGHAKTPSAMHGCTSLQQGPLMGAAAQQVMLGVNGIAAAPGADAEECFLLSVLLLEFVTPI